MISKSVKGPDAFTATCRWATQPHIGHGTAWTSSDPTIVPTSDPPILTAVAAGHVTITAGTASADVTVWAGALPLGTVIWSNPGDGSGVQSIVPAVPSTSGVADVFAFQADGTVAAITSDGTTAWTADVSQATGGQPQGSWPGYVLPDFQGGLVVLNYDFNVNSISSIVKLDGSTGEPYPAYTPGPSASIQNAVVHADGTIFALQENWTDPNHDAPLPTTIVGIDPTTGAQKFSVQVNVPQDETSWLGGSMIIAGDGYAYLPYKYLNVYMDGAGESHYIGHIRLLRVSSSGASDAIAIEDGFESCVECSWGSYIITNADQGLLLTWDGGGTGMATTVGTSASLVAPPSPANLLGIVDPVLQAQDGSFVGWYYAGDQYQCCETNMVAFDASGNVRWVVPNEQPQIATADGGVIGQSGITYDQNGNATGMMGSLPTYSWTGSAYLDGPVTQVLANPLYAAVSFWPFSGANNSGNGTAASQPQYAALGTCTATPGCIGPHEAIYDALDDLIRRLQSHATVTVGPDGTPYTLGSLAQAKVFGKLGTGSDGAALYTTGDFVRYLTAKRPRFYNGLDSQFCNDELTPISVLNPPCIRFLGKTWLGQTVAAYFKQNTSTDAETGTPSNPLLTFFRPSGILYNSQGSNQANEGMLFHEALHGFTSLQDSNILEDLGYGNSVTTASCNITKYIQQAVLRYATSLDPTTNNVGCDPATDPPPGITP